MIEEINSIKQKAAQPEGKKKKKGTKKAAKSTKKWAGISLQPLTDRTGAT